jgi:hypothetical protein
MTLYYFFMKSYDELIWLATAGHKKSQQLLAFHSDGKRQLAQ